jgi:hypothetical protein
VTTDGAGSAVGDDGDLAVTIALTEFAGTPLPASVPAALAGLEPSLIEWSVNPTDSRHGAFRLAAWSDDAARIDCARSRTR